MNLNTMLVSCLSLACVLALSSCEGNSGEEDGMLFLEADKTAITADGADAATFTVYYGNTDVTSEAVITCTTDGSVLEDAAFTTTVAGTYAFTASWDGNESTSVSVTAQPDGGTDEPSEPSAFVREVCVFYYTYQTCSFCPSGYRYLSLVIGNSYSGIAHILSVHASTGDDMFAFPYESEMSTDMEVQGYPDASMDMRPAIGLSADKSGVRPAIESSINDYPAHCGVAVGSVYDESEGTAEVTVDLYSELTDTYRLAVYIVEDGIVGSQTDSGITYDDYVHHYVARRLVSSSYKGDSLGTVEEDTETSRSYTVTVDPEWDLDNTTVYALAIDSDGYVNNMAVCPLKDGSVSYNYVEEQ